MNPPLRRCTKQASKRTIVYRRLVEAAIPTTSQRASIDKANKSAAGPIQAMARINQRMLKPAAHSTVSETKMVAVNNPASTLPREKPFQAERV